MRTYLTCIVLQLVWHTFLLRQKWFCYHGRDDSPEPKTEVHGLHERPPFLVPQGHEVCIATWKIDTRSYMSDHLTVLSFLISLLTKTRATDKTLTPLFLDQILCLTIC